MKLNCIIQVPILSLGFKQPSISNSQLPCSQMIDLQGHLLFRERIILSILSGKSLKISKIRSDLDNPGLERGEISFLKLIEKITEGSTIEINHTGTAIKFKPGIIKGGEVEHDCDLSKSIGFYLEPLIAIAPFSKFAFKLTLTGITTQINKESGPSVDALRLGYIPLLKHYGIENMDLIQLKVPKRGAHPLGGGEVHFSCPVILASVPWNLKDEGKVCKIRGIATTCRVSPQIANRLVEASRSHLNPFLNDIYIHTDVLKGAESGRSPGWNLCLVAETTKGTVYFSEGCGGANIAPEDVAEQVSKDLLKKINFGGVVDCKLHRMLMLMMSCGPSDLFKAKISAPSSLTQSWLRELDAFMGVAFKMRNCTTTEDKSAARCVNISVIGTGFVNFGKRAQ